MSKSRFKVGDRITFPTDGDYGVITAITGLYYHVNWERDGEYTHRIDGRAMEECELDEVSLAKRIIAYYESLAGDLTSEINEVQEEQKENN